MLIQRVVRDHHRRGPNRSTILLAVVTTMSLSPTTLVVLTIMVLSLSRTTTPMSIPYLGRILTPSPSLNLRHIGMSPSLSPIHTGTRLILNRTVPRLARVPSRRVRRLPTAARVPREARELSQSQKARRHHTPSRR